MQQMRLSLIVLAVVMLSTRNICAAEKFSSSPLVTAQRLAAKEFQGWTYGSSKKAKQIDCVQFLASVIAAFERRSLSAEEIREIYINNIGKDEDINALVESGDIRTRGVQNYLIQAGKGKAVDPTKVERGDFIQYWYLDGGKTWKGHAAIVAEVHRGVSTEVVLFGSHQSLGGIGLSKFRLNITDPQKKVYLARYKNLEENN